MTVPTIHPNGTSKLELLMQLDIVAVALENAYQAMKKSAPNWRDYYPQGPNALDQVTQEHMGRLRKIDEVSSEIDRLIIAIDKQGE